MKTVYWSVIGRNAGFYLIEFWSKPDRSNVLKAKLVTTEGAKLRRWIENETGMKHFELEHVKGDYR